MNLIHTCELNDVNPFEYLRDVLVRIADHPARDTLTLSPKAWKKPSQNLDAGQVAAVG